MKMFKNNHLNNVCASLTIVKKYRWKTTIQSFNSDRHPAIVLLFLIFYLILACTLTCMRFQDMTKANMVDEVANKNQKTFSQTLLESTHQWYPWAVVLLRNSRRILKSNFKKNTFKDSSFYLILILPIPI